MAQIGPQEAQIVPDWFQKAQIGPDCSRKPRLVQNGPRKGQIVPTRSIYTSIHIHINLYISYTET